MPRSDGRSRCPSSARRGRARCGSTARVVDREGAPVEGARVGVEAFPSARASQVITAALAPEAGGGYAARGFRSIGRGSGSCASRVSAASRSSPRPSTRISRERRDRARADRPRREPARQPALRRHVRRLRRLLRGRPARARNGRALAGHLAYNLGRLVAYAALGALAGALGAALDLGGARSAFSASPAAVAGVVIALWGDAALLEGLGGGVPRLGRRRAGPARAPRHGEHRGVAPGRARSRSDFSPAVCPADGSTPSW